MLLRWRAACLSSEWVDREHHAWPVHQQAFWWMDVGDYVILLSALLAAVPEEISLLVPQDHDHTCEVDGWMWVVVLPSLYEMEVSNSSLPKRKESVIHSQTRLRYSELSMSDSW